MAVRASPRSIPIPLRGSSPDETPAGPPRTILAPESSNIDAQSVVLSCKHMAEWPFGGHRGATEGPLRGH
ncbi:hypothetical protein EYF80_015699 [Liparis tanakae]|uniref:Uncharacterized protein n=1 Tax=Liparis tanakae TaxID=230148 RepID=A0A4Z2I7Z2_9TELE|nr:hypothetical protein EYF80_015699 [Liparis tanakae]